MATHTSDISAKLKAAAAQERITAVQVAVELTTTINGRTSGRRMPQFSAFEDQIPEAVAEWLQSRIDSDAT